MAAAAVLLAILTILVGTLVLAEVGPTVTARTTMGCHIALAMAGVVVLCVAALAADVLVTLAALVVLLGAGGLGLRTLLTTPRKGRPSGMVLAHGVAAAATLLLAVGLAATR